MLHVAFAGTFTAMLEQPVRRHLTTPCEIIVASEIDILPRLAEIDVLVTMGLTAEMARAAPRLKLVQVPGAGIDRIDRSALSEGALLANAFGHEVGIAEYVIGAMLALTREFSRLDAALRQGEWQSHWAVGVAPPPLTGGLDSRSPAAPGPSTCKSARSAAMSGNRWRTTVHCSAVRTSSTLCWSAAITSSSRCPPARRRSDGSARRSFAG
jgi:hypothetical protein